MKPTLIDPRACRCRPFWASGRPFWASGRPFWAGLALLVCFALLAPFAGAQDDEWEVIYNDEGEPLITIAARDLPVPIVLSQITMFSNIPVRPEGQVAGMKITITAADRPFLEVLNTIAAQLNCVVFSEEGKPEYILIDHDTYRQKYLPQQTEKRVFQLRNVPPEEVQQMIEGILTPGVGAAIVDLRTGQLIVNDVPQVLAAIEEFISFIEIKPVLRVFRIEQGDLAFIAETLQNESMRFLGTEINLVIDEENRRIIVIGAPEHIQQLETWVEILDIRPEMRRYPLYNVGAEGYGYGVWETIIVDLLTPDAFFIFDYQNHVLIVRDLPEVHEDLERLLSQIDKPPIQIFIQAEIIETRFSHGFDYGIQYQFNENLSAATQDGLPTLWGGEGIGVNTDRPDEFNLLDLGQEFPNFLMSGDGFIIDQLSRQAYAKFNAAMSDTETHMLAQPRIYVKNHEYADIVIGTSTPYFTSTFYNNVGGGFGGYGQNSNTVQFATDGIRLNINSVSVSEGDLVELELDISNNVVDIVQRQTVNGIQDAPETSEQEISTVLNIPNGNTRIVGGLITNSTTQSRSGIPYLKDIPWVGGLLFGTTSKKKEQRNLLVFITPYIIRPEHSILTPEPIDLYPQRGETIELAQDIGYAQDVLQQIMEEQFAAVPAIEDEMLFDPTLADQLTTDVAALVDPALQSELRIARFTPKYLDLSRFQRQLLTLLSPQGEILEWDVRPPERNSVVVQDLPGQLDLIQQFLTAQSEEAMRGDPLVLPEDLIVVAEKVDKLITQPTEQVSGFDPMRAYTNFRITAGGATGIFGRETVHKGGLTSRASTSGTGATRRPNILSRTVADTRGGSRTSRSRRGSSARDSRNRTGQLGTGSQFNPLSTGNRGNLGGGFGGSGFPPGSGFGGGGFNTRGTTGGGRINDGRTGFETLYQRGR